MTDLRSASAAFLAERHELLAYLQALCGDAQQAEDVLQDVWVALAEAVQAGQEIRSVPAWCRTVARHTFLRHRRAARRERADDEVVMAALERVFAATARSEGEWTRHLAALRRCLEAVGAAAQRLLARRYLDGVTTGTLAAEEAIAEEAVLMRLSRVRAKLRRCVDGRLVEEQA